MKDTTKRWIEALRSGKYKQGRDYLKIHDQYCCLGVMCDIHDSGEWKLWGYVSYYHGFARLPPQAVYELYTPNNTKDVNRRIMRALSFLNDKGMNFNEIANIIESVEYNNFEIYEYKIKFMVGDKTYMAGT